MTNGEYHKLIIEGLKNSLLCRLLDKAEKLDGPNGGLIEAHIAGVHNDSFGTENQNTFNGFNDGHIYELDNGQLWEQIESYIRVFIPLLPTVMIWKNGTVYKMKVEETGKAVTVRQCSAVALRSIR